tara:strand:- start:479 stop:748 length:270 start_codon:yes stop_codon:yes gene_type:complete
MTKHEKFSPAPFQLDITSEVCPLTFVKTKLMLEKMPVNSALEIRLKGKEPLKNVPTSILEHGYAILSFKPEEPYGAPDRIHRLLVQKNS